MSWFAAAHPDDVFVRRLQDAIASRGATLEMLGRGLAQRGTPVSVATLSYWRSGRSVPRRRSSLRAVEGLEVLLGLQPGWLVGALAELTPGGWDPMTVLPPHPDLATTVSDLGLDLGRRKRTEVLRDSLRVGSSHVEREVGSLVLCEVDRLEVVLLVVEMEVSGGEWTLAGGAGAVVEEVRELSGPPGDGSHLLVARMALSEPLRQGERAWLGWSLRVTAGMGSSRRLVTARPDRTRFLVQEVFLEQEPPAWAEYVLLPSRQHLDGGSAGPAATRPSTVVPGRQMQYVQRNAPAGLHVVRWG